jgi:LysR family transcriptional regulator, low CO2-responsive transcriptional regulator
LAASSLFAEHAAPGLIELFASRAADLDVELSVRATSQFPALLAGRAVDVAIGPPPAALSAGMVATPFLRYEVTVVCGPRHPLTHGPATVRQVREQDWLLGPAAAGTDGVVPDLLRRLGVPEDRQRIFQSDAAAFEEIRRGGGVGLAVRFAVTGDLRAGRLVEVKGPGLRGAGSWAALALPAHSQPPAAAELLRFVTTPRATQAMVRGSGVKAGRFKPSVHVTLWS